MIQVSVQNPNQKKRMLLVYSSETGLRPVNKLLGKMFGSLDKSEFEIGEQLECDSRCDAQFQDKTTHFLSQ